MRKQRNLAQMNEQSETPEKELNKMEKSNLLDIEFKTVIIVCSMIKKDPVRNEGYSN